MKTRILFAYCLIAWSCSAQTISDTLVSTKSDQERIIGEWAYLKTLSNGQLVYSTEEKDVQQLIEDIWKKDESTFLEMGITKAQMAEQMKELCKKLAATTFSFKEDGQVFLSNDEDHSKDEANRYEINLQEKEITIIENQEKERIYRYDFIENQLVLKLDEDELILIRKSE